MVVGILDGQLDKSVRKVQSGPKVAQNGINKMVREEGGRVKEGSRARQSQHSQESVIGLTSMHDNRSIMNMMPARDCKYPGSYCFSSRPFKSCRCTI